MKTPSRVVFPRRGHRKKRGGLRFVSKCRRWMLYKADQVEGVRWPTAWWFLYDVANTPGVCVGRFRKRATAERDANRRAAAQSHEEASS